MSCLPKCYVPANSLETRNEALALQEKGGGKFWNYQQFLPHSASRQWLLEEQGQSNPLPAHHVLKLRAKLESRV